MEGANQRGKRILRERQGNASQMVWLSGAAACEQGGLGRVSWVGSQEKMQANFGFRISRIFGI
jgi:hypothetical protein